jgi:hypothetical protein
MISIIYSYPGWQLHLHFFDFLLLQGLLGSQDRSSGNYYCSQVKMQVPMSCCCRLACQNIIYKYYIEWDFTPQVSIVNSLLPWTWSWFNGFLNLNTIFFVVKYVCPGPSGLKRTRGCWKVSAEYSQGVVNIRVPWVTLPPISPVFYLTVVAAIVCRWLP